MSSRWYSSCRGVEHGGHKLALVRRPAWLWGTKRLLVCAEPECDLEMKEPKIRPRLIGIQLRYENFKYRYGIEFQVWPSVVIILGIIAVGYMILAGAVYANG